MVSGWPVLAGIFKTSEFGQLRSQFRHPNIWVKFYISVHSKSITLLNFGTPDFTICTIETRLKVFNHHQGRSSALLRISSKVQ